MDGRMDRQTDGRVDRQMNGRIDRPYHEDASWRQKNNFNSKLLNYKQRSSPAFICTATEWKFQPRCSRNRNCGESGGRGGGGGGGGGGGRGGAGRRWGEGPKEETQSTCDNGSIFCERRKSFLWSPVLQLVMLFDGTWGATTKNGCLAPSFRPIIEASIAGSRPDGTRLSRLYRIQMARHPKCTISMETLRVPSIQT